MTKRYVNSLAKSAPPRNRPTSRPASRGAARTRSTRKSRPNSTPAVPAALVAQGCGLVDPWCAHAVGAKYPDDSSARTLPRTTHSVRTLTTDANGRLSTVFWPSYLSTLSIDATSSNSSTGTFGTFGVSTASNAEVESYRIVSWGVRLRRISAPLTTTGMLRLREIGTESGADMGVVQMDVFGRTQSLDIPLVDATLVTAIGGHTSQPAANFYPAGYNVAGVDITDFKASGFNPITVRVEGGPATTAVLDVEMIIHYELNFLEDSSFKYYITPAPPSNSFLTSAAAVVTSTAKSFYTENAEAVQRGLKALVLNAIVARFPFLRAGLRATPMIVN